jgi:hypothetical protein
MLIQGKLRNLLESLVVILCATSFDSKKVYVMATKYMYVFLWI